VYDSPPQLRSLPLSSRPFAAALILLCPPAALFAQDTIPPVDTTSQEPLRDSTVTAAPRTVVQTDTLGRPIINYIEIDRSDVFTEAEAKHWLPRLVNGLHITTSEGVITRELLVHVGDPYDSAKVAETARHLRALGVFAKVRIDTVSTDSGFVMTVKTQDGWSTQPSARFRSAGSQTDWQLALMELNLLGTASYFAGSYRHTPDRNQTSFQFIQPRLIARTVSLGLTYQSLSDGSRERVAISRPFFSLSDQSGITTLLDVSNQRVLQFRDGVATPSDSLRRIYTIGRVEAATALNASPAGYVHVGLTAQVKREDYGVWPVTPGTQSVSATVGTFLEIQRAKYVVTRGFTTLARDEDVDVSRFARLGVYAAPSFLGYDRGGVGFLVQGRLGTRLPNGFAWLDVRANGLYTAAGLDSGSATLGGTAVFLPARKHLLITHADIGWIKNPQPSTEFDLGFATGPRGFPIHAFTGDRTYFATAEYRYIVAADLLKSLDLGLAGFVDHGGAWWHDENRRTGTDIGFGFRLSPSRAAGTNATRLDMAYRFKTDVQRAGWLFVVASGLVFSTQPRQ